MSLECHAFEAAQQYLANGWVPLPVHYIVNGGRCSCRNHPCEPIGKHPVGLWSETNRDNALDKFTEWYGKHPGTNIGIRTGVISGLVVLDIDVKPGQKGIESLESLITKYGELPETLRAWTGSGGMHIFFAAPLGPVPCSVSSVGPGLDVRGDGGQVVAAPSRHKSGGVYEWENWGTPLAQIPEWLLFLMRSNAKKVVAVAPNDQLAYARQRLIFHRARIGEAPEGEGRNRLNQAAFEMGHFVKLIPAEEIFAEFRKAAGNWTNPMDPDRLEKTIHEGLRDGEAEALVKPEIVINVNIKDMIDQATDALSQVDNIFRRGGDLVRVCKDVDLPKQTLREPITMIQPIPMPSIREELSSCIDWIKINRGKEGLVRKPEYPPQSVVDGVKSRADWPPIRHLEMVTTTPIMRLDTTLIETPGYDQSTGVIYAPDFEHEPVPPNPTLVDVKNAVAEIDDVIGEFIFEAPAHRAAWFASVLTPLARSAIRGTAPMFLVDSSMQGTGKTMLVRLACIIATGSDPPTASFNSNDDEMRKLITTFGISGQRTYFLDNIDSRKMGNLGGPSLCKALTSPYWSDRVLGGSTEWTGKLTGVWYGSGNNVSVEPDMARRIVHIRICPTQERPDEKSRWKYPALVNHTKLIKHKLLRAALTILRGRYTAGVPDFPLTAWGDYVEWGNIVRQACMIAGVGDPAETRSRLRDLADIENDAMRIFVRGWAEIANKVGGTPKTPITTKTVLSQLYPMTGQSQYPAMRDATDELVRVRNGVPSSMQIAGLLRKLRNRIFDGMTIDLIDKKNDVAYWAVVPAMHVEEIQ